MIDWRLTVAANMGKQALEFLVLHDAMKMSMIQKGLTEQEADEIINEVLHEAAGQYRKSGIKERIEVTATHVFSIVPPWGHK